MHRLRSSSPSSTPSRRIPIPYPRHRQQSGVTLISLMIGMVISLIMLTAMLLSYRHVIQITGEAKRQAVANDQFTSALLRAQISLQDAGFGVDAPAYGSNLVVLGDAGLTDAVLSGTQASSGSAGNAVVWDWKANGATHCAALLSGTAGATTLRYLTPASGSTCTSAGQWSSMSWNDAPLSTSVAAAHIYFTAEQQDCTPFGIEGIDGGLTLVITPVKPDDLPDETTQALSGYRPSAQQRQCLTNFPESSSS